MSASISRFQQHRTRIWVKEHVCVCLCVIAWSWNGKGVTFDSLFLLWKTWRHRLMSTFQNTHTEKKQHEGKKHFKQRRRSLERRQIKWWLTGSPCHSQVESNSHTTYTFSLAHQRHLPPHPHTFYKSTSCSGKDALSEVLLRSVTDSMNTIKNFIFSLFPTYPGLLFTKVQIHVNTCTPALSDLIIGHDFKSNSLFSELAYTPQ